MSETAPCYLYAMRDADEAAEQFLEYAALLAVGRHVSKQFSKPRYVKPPASWLYRKYEIEKLDANQIAGLIGCDGKTAWLWLKQAGIQKRGRGHGRPANHFKKGQRSGFAGRKLSAESRLKIGLKSRGRNPYANIVLNPSRSSKSTAVSALNCKCRMWFTAYRCPGNNTTSVLHRTSNRA